MAEKHPWEDLDTDIPEPGVETDMGMHHIAGDAEPLPDGDGERDREGEY